MAAAQQSVNKPLTAYWLWLGENREKITKICGTGKGSEVSKKGGEMWKAMSESAKKPFESLAKEKKDAYEKFIATPEGQKLLQEKKAGQAEVKAEKTQKEEKRNELIAQKEEKRNERDCKKAVKSVEKDEALKKPISAYWMWLSDSREEIVKILGSAKGSEVAKKGGEMWKSLSAAKRAPYDQKAKEQKEKYDKYVASAEGAQALQAFKDGVKEAKGQFVKPNDAPVAETTENEKKRKADSEGTSPSKDAGVKKARGRPAKVQTATLGA